MFEVQDLRYATLATVSRCGMIWFSEHVLSLDMIFENYLRRLSFVPLEGSDEAQTAAEEAGNESLSAVMSDQRCAATCLRPVFAPDGLVVKALEQALNYDHIMDFTRLRALGSMFTMFNQCVRNVINYNQNRDFRLADEISEKYVTKSLVLAVVWSFAGDCKLKYRQELGEFVRASTTIQMPTNTALSIVDFEVLLETGEWAPWLAKVYLFILIIYKKSI